MRGWRTSSTPTTDAGSPDAPKGEVNVNVEHGRVVLRGELATRELIDELERRVRKVVGVREVDNRLHVPAAEPEPVTARRRRTRT
ncbi:MAG TPA: BON domain-containing protein [Gaiella sp.]